MHVLDESVIGGLSLLLMAGQHDASITASPVLTGADTTKPNNLLMNAVSLHPQPCQVKFCVNSTSNCSFWRIRWEIIRTVLCCMVFCSCAQS